MALYTPMFMHPGQWECLLSEVQCWTIQATFRIDSQTEEFNSAEWTEAITSSSFLFRAEIKIHSCSLICVMCCYDVAPSVHWNCLSDSGTTRPWTNLCPYQQERVIFLIFLSRCQIQFHPHYMTDFIFLCRFNWIFKGRIVFVSHKKKKKKQNAEIIYKCQQ